MLAVEKRITSPLLVGCLPTCAHATAAMLLQGTSHMLHQQCAPRRVLGF